MSQLKLKSFRANIKELSFNFPRNIFLVGLAISLLALSGCQQSQQISKGSSLFVSEAGVKMDALLPDQFFGLVKIGTDDQIQLKTLKTLVNYFPTGSNEKLNKFFLDSLGKVFANSPTGLNILTSDDLASLLTEKSQLVLTIAQPEDKADQMDTSGDLVQTQVDSSEKVMETSPASLDATSPSAIITKSNFTATKIVNPPQLVQVISVKDQAQAEKAFNKLAGNADFKKENYKEFNYLLSDKGPVPLYIATYKDVVIMTTDLERLQIALDNARDNKDSTILKNNVNFQKALVDYQPSNIGFFYIEAKDQYFSFVKNLTSGLNAKDSDAADMEVVQKSLNSIRETLGMNSVEGGSYVFTAENNGIRVKMKTTGKNFLTKNDSLYSKLLQSFGSSYLYKKMPGGSPMMYFESNNLSQLWEVEVQLLASMDPRFEKGYPEFKKILSTENIDFEKDILAFLDKGVAFSFGNNGSLLPDMVFVADASSNSDGAKKIMDKLNGLVDLGIKQMEAKSSQVKGVILKEQKTNDGNNFWSVKLDMKKLLTQTGAIVGVPEQVLSQKVEFYYGVNSDKLAFTAFSPDFTDNYGKTSVGQSDEFQKARDFIKGYDVSIVYFSPAEFFNYIDNIVNLVKKANPAAATNMQEYEQVKPYISPFKSFIMAGSKATDSEINAEAFLRIGQ